jgi:NitT/TauT family transport system ATP-binding protein
VVVKGVWKWYGETSVLEAINLEVESGSFVTLVGASGCGKTTFLRLLLGQEAPSRGAITVDGAPLEGEPGPERGIVFQRYSVYPHLSVLGNVALGLEFRESRWLGRLFGARRRRALERAQLLLEAVGLTHARDAMPASLSGGMQQRVAIAQALILEPKMLLLDEPFGALDPGIRNDMHELVTDLWRKSRMTVFMVTHDIREAFKLGTRVLTFDKVRIDPHEPHAYGATITYDLPGFNRPALPEEKAACAPAPSPSPSLEQVVPAPP